MFLAAVLIALLIFIVPVTSVITALAQKNVIQACGMLRGKKKTCFIFFHKYLKV
jgi:hypothetical protein